MGANPNHTLRSHFNNLSCGFTENLSVTRLESMIYFILPE